MKKTLILTSLIIFLNTLVGSWWVTSAKASQSLSTTGKSNIQQVTILIVMQAPAQQKYALVQGLGTLVQYQGTPYLVTHNHWGDVLQDLTSVELRDAENKLVKVIFGKEFKRLIYYQDAGTLVLYLPEGWPVGIALASLATGSHLKVGDIVQVAYRENPERKKVTILEAVVQNVSQYEGLSIYEIHSLYGQTLKPGDSGGGVWFDGELVANNWAVITTSASQATSGIAGLPAKTYTELSFAAVMPEDF